jgi:outer membrane lipase/esterase
MIFPRALKRAAFVGLALCASALIASCGGGDQAESFVPGRVLAFGDENSVVEAGSGTTDGRKYGVNALDAGTSTPACGTYPTWVQILAYRYGYVFPECRGTAVGPASRILANVAERRAAQVKDQVDRFVASADGPFRSNDLVTVWTGAADVVEQSLSGVADADKLAAVTAAASSLAQQVNRMADAGAKVVIVTVPNVGLTPYGYVSPERYTLLAGLTREFNTTLRAQVYNDGRRIGLIDADESIRSIYTLAGQGFVDVLHPLCSPASTATPNAPSTACTTATLVAGGDPATWLWADNLRLSPAGQGRIGILAVERMGRFPF